MADKEDVNVLDALKGAAEGGSESSTGGTEKNASPASKDEGHGKGSDNGMIPRSRYNELRTEFDNAQKGWATKETQLSSQLQEAQKSVATLSDLIKGAQEDRDLVASLRGLAKDPKYTDLITKVDNALRGVDEDEEEGKVTEKEAQISRKQIVAELRDELDERFTDQMHGLISQQADALAKQYLDRLPAEYTEADRKVISKLWAGEVDWDAVEKDPSKLGDFLSTSLQKTLDDYGTPRGKLTSQKADETKQTEHQTKEPTTEERVNAILGKEWGKLKSVKTASGKEVLVPEMSEDEYNAEFAKTFRLLNK